MAIFDAFNIRLPGESGGRRPVSRAEAEDYAASLGLRPGGPGWGDAIRDYVLIGIGGPPNQGQFTPRISEPMIGGHYGDPASPGPAGPGFVAPVRDAAFSIMESPHFTTGLATPTSISSESEFENAHAELPITSSRLANPGPHPTGAGQAFAMRGEGHSPQRARRLAAAPARSSRAKGPSPRDRLAIESLLRPAELGQPAGEGSLGDRFRTGRAGLLDGVQSWKGKGVQRPRGLPSGTLAEQEETGGRGMGTISSGIGDRGGMSFGPFQLASAAKMVQGFVNSLHGLVWHDELAHLSPKDPLFQQKWKSISSKHPAAFRRAQQSFLADELYNPTVDDVWEGTGLDLDDMSDAVREAVWSASMQHRDASSFLIPAIAAADRRAARAGNGARSSSLAYDEVLIQEIYRHRVEYVRNLRNRTPDQRHTDQKMIAGRYPRELKAALLMLRQEAGRSR